MWVGRGSDEIDQIGSWAGAVTPKPPINLEKSKFHRPTGGPTDGPTDKAGCRVACTRLKNHLFPISFRFLLVLVARIHSYRLMRKILEIARFMLEQMILRPINNRAKFFLLGNITSWDTICVGHLSRGGSPKKSSSPTPLLSAGHRVLLTM